MIFYTVPTDTARKVVLTPADLTGVTGTPALSVISDSASVPTLSVKAAQGQASTSPMIQAVDVSGNNLFQVANVSGAPALGLNLGTTAPAYGIHQIGGQSRLVALATPAAPVITNGGTAGTTTYTYFIVAVDQFGNKTLASASGATTTGNATLSATNYNILTWTTVQGAVSYDILKTNTTTKLVNVPAAVGIATQVYNDIGAATGAYVAPTRNTTADATIDGLMAPAFLAKPVPVSLPTVAAAGAAYAGSVVLVAGTATVSTTAVTANSVILLSRLVAGGTAGTAYAIGTIVAGTSFVINAFSSGTTAAAADTSTIGYVIIG